MTLKKCGYNALAKKTAMAYMKLIDGNFTETGNLWEKYSGIDGRVANADYNAPEMMG